MSDEGSIGPVAPVCRVFVAGDEMWPEIEMPLTTP
jgi:hypothetical protein